MDPFPCYAENLLWGTKELTLKQQAVYFRLICVLYVRDGYVIDDDRLVATLLSIDIRTWKSVKAVLRARHKVWVGNDGFLKTRRLETLIKFVRSHRRSDGDPTEIERDLSEKPNDFSKTTQKLAKSPPLSSSSSSQSIKKVRKEVGEIDATSLLTADWTPDSSVLMLGDQLGFTQTETLDYLDHMRDWATAKSARSANWNARARQWLRDQLKHRSNGNGRVENTKSTSAVARRWREAGFVPDLGPKPSLLPQSSRTDVELLSQKRGK